MSKRKKSIINVFPQHVIPDELSILSLYEIIVYLLILLGCWVLYSKWNEIPVIHSSLNIERLDSLSQYHKPSLLKADFTIPVSSVFKDTAGYSYSFDTFILEKKDTFVQGPTLQYLDSLKNEYASLRPDSLGRAFSGPLFYVKYSQKIMSKGYSPIRMVTLDKTLPSLRDIDHEPYYCFAIFDYLKENNDYAIHTTYINGYNGDSPTSIKERTLMTPKTFSLWDISQTYYEIDIQCQNSIDSIIVKYNFEGAAEITPIGSIPYSISGNSVQFMMDRLHPHLWMTRKGIINEGQFSKAEKIRFHVKYKDLENRQNRRMFLVTAVLSGLITIFLAFIIIFIYRLIRLCIDRSKQKEDDSQ